MPLDRDPGVGSVNDLAERSGSLGTLVGLIAGASARGSIGTLVSAPAWLMAFVCALIAFALVRSCKLARPSKHRFTIACCAIAGTVCGLGLPPSFDPARSVVMTHAPVRSSATPLFAALEQLDERPQSLLGRRITVSGSWHPPEPGAVAAVSQRVMACCAADAVDVGFDVVPARAVGFAAGESVSVSGIVRASLRDGETRYALTDADVRFSARSISARSSDAK